MTDCPYSLGWINEEGWFVQDDGKLVCLDWDDYCTICRVDDTKDFIFAITETSNTHTPIKEAVTSSA